MRASRFCFVTFLAFVCPVAAVAQTTGAIDGRVTDGAGSPLPGAAVEVTSPRLQGSRTATTGRDGYYRVPATPPGDYVIQARLNGFRWIQKTAAVRLGATATADFVLEPATAEQVLVSGQAPHIDETSTTTGTNYTSENIRQLPVDRNYASIALANPGTGPDFGYTDGRFQPLSIYGATSSENQWIIDGVNTTNVRFGTQGKAMNNEFVQELEVKTDGYSAEYGRATGGIINVVTKSGGNTFHGDAYAYYDTSDTMAARRIDQTDQILVGTKLDDGTNLNYGADLGGFLVKDTLWFFGSYDRATLDAHVSRLTPHRDVPTDYLFPLNAESNLWSGKLTWNAAPSTTIVGEAFGDPNTNSGLAGADPRRGLSDLQWQAPVSADPDTWYSYRRQGGTDFGLSGTQVFGPAFIASLRGGYHQDRSSLAAAERVRVTDLTCAGGTPDHACSRPRPPNSVTGGFGFIIGGNNADTSRGQVAANATIYKGTHEIGAGGDYMDGRETLRSHYTGRQSVTIWNNYGQIYYEHVFYALAGGDAPLDSYTQRSHLLQYSAYLQDSWRAASNLTVNLGLRWDGGQIRDFRDKPVFGTESVWQPRIGVVWDPWRDGLTKVYAFAGRFSYGMSTGSVSGMFLGGVARVSTYNFDPLSTVQDPTVINHENPQKGVFAVDSPVDPNLKFPSQDEVLVGIERMLGPSLTVGLKGTYRRLNDVIAIRYDLDYTSPLTGFSSYAAVNPGSGERFASGDVPTCNGLDPPYDQCSPTGPAMPEGVRIYRGIELLARQVLGRDLWVQASYVHSSLRGNTQGPAFYADYDYPSRWEENAYGNLPLDRPNRFRLDGYWVTPWRLSMGLQFFVESGAPLNKQVYAGFNTGLAYLVPRGTAGRLPTLWEGNLQLSYPIDLGPVTATLQAQLFNMFNNQIPILTDTIWSWDQPEGYPATVFDPNRPQTNDAYGQVLARSAPRLFRAAIRLSF